LFFINFFTGTKDTLPTFDKNQCLERNFFWGVTYEFFKKKKKVKLVQIFQKIGSKWGIVVMLWQI